ncbi:MAG: YitT family protein [Clostridia bacterium]|nr:YitT family protein [Clostridia bacterium]
MILKNKKLLFEYFVNLLFWTAGSIIFAIAINTFTAPNQIAAGGVSGIATLLNHKLGIPIGIAMIAINVPLFALSWKFFGIKFVIKTGIVLAIMSVAIDVIPPLFAYQDDRLLSAMFGGFLMGFGLALIFLRGATSGGTDIAARLLQLKFSHLPVGRVILLVDIVVVIASVFVYGSIESGLYSTLVIFLSSITLDKVLYGSGSAKVILIITDMPSEICSAISDKLNRGATIIPSQGAYTGDDKTIVLCAASKSETAKMNKLIKSIDKNAFTIVMEAGEIIGKGFRKINH